MFISSHELAVLPNCSCPVILAVPKPPCQTKLEVLPQFAEIGQKQGENSVRAPIAPKGRKRVAVGASPPFTSAQKTSQAPKGRHRKTYPRSMSPRRGFWCGSAGLDNQELRSSPTRYDPSGATRAPSTTYRTPFHHKRGGQKEALKCGRNLVECVVRLGEDYGKGDWEIMGMREIKREIVGDYHHRSGLSAERAFNSKVFRFASAMMSAPIRLVMKYFLPSSPTSPSSPYLLSPRFSYSEGHRRYLLRHASFLTTNGGSTPINAPIKTVSTGAP